ncbi:hypothetical protein [Alteribacter aurantiacus]|uniref:hypothetical protein n=1 Tax=Alteribacter aurantiacus TaxID=254410 RepID=UPI0003F7279A|nr:hypothetical protein [Alteribacter aurantiacus]
MALEVKRVLLIVLGVVVGLLMGQVFWVPMMEDGNLGLLMGTSLGVGISLLLVSTVKPNT